MTPYQSADDPQFLADLRAALRRWPRAALGETALAARLPADPHRSRAEALRALLRAALDRLRAEGRAEEADLLERRYRRAQGVHRLCQTYHLSERSLYYRLKEATLALAHALWSLTPTAPDRLPPPNYSRLFGFETLLAELLARLTDPDDHWLIGIEGLGGLGKTALAREAVARLVETEPDRFASHLTDIVWVTARQESYTWRGLEGADRPALTFERLLDAIAEQLGADDPGPLPPAARQEQVRALLRARPCLVVVDNLETAADSETLPARLWALARPSKFLLTSRCRIAPGPGVSILPLGELAEADALALLRYEG
ncbi:MAG TPA: hypothetical protein ENJ31_08635, partial [Anaerolineae bacterium]|nr:hypothetical protein [Anaerolineae bacterium]